MCTILRKSWECGGTPPGPLANGSAYAILLQIRSPGRADQGNLSPRIERPAPLLNGCQEGRGPVKARAVPPSFPHAGCGTRTLIRYNGRTRLGIARSSDFRSHCNTNLKPENRT